MLVGVGAGQQRWRRRSAVPRIHRRAVSYCSGSDVVLAGRLTAVVQTRKGCIGAYPVWTMSPEPPIVCALLHGVWAPVGARLGERLVGLVGCFLVGCWVGCLLSCLRMSVYVCDTGTMSQEPGSRNPG